MLNPTLTAALVESISQAILAPAIRHADDVTHIHVLQDAIQKIRQPRYHTHPDFTTGYTYGQTYYLVHKCAGSLSLSEIIVVLRDNLARHDHDELNAFYHVIGCQTIDYAYRVGFVLGWLAAVVEHGYAPVYPTITSLM